MPKTKQQSDWLDAYFDDRTARGLPIERSRVIADRYNAVFNTTAFRSGSPPKNRIIMTNGGLDAQTVGG